MAATLVVIRVVTLLAVGSLDGGLGNTGMFLDLLGRDKTLGPSRSSSANTGIGRAPITMFPVVVHIRFIDKHLWAVGALKCGCVVVFVHVPNIVVFVHETTITYITAIYRLVRMYLLPMASQTPNVLETTSTYIAAKPMQTLMHFRHVASQTQSSRVRVSSVAFRTVQWLFIGWSFLAH